jgi:hypothetical protein
MPGGLDQEPADVAVADLGDRPLPAVLAGGVLRGHETDEGHELLGGAEATEVADLGDQAERGRRVDAAQAPQPGDELTPRPLLGRRALRRAFLPGVGLPFLCASRICSTASRRSIFAE